MKTECEWCGERMKPFFVDQRFCSPKCSAAWHVAERREAVELYRAQGLVPRTPATAQHQQVAAE
jgi:hypothetical protein